MRSVSVQSNFCWSSYLCINISFPTVTFDIPPYIPQSSPACRSTFTITSFSLMSSESESKKKKKKKASEVEVLSWQQKKELIDREEAAMEREVEELLSWTSMIESMDDNQLKEYLQNRPESLKSVKIGKVAPGKKVQRNAKTRSSSSSSRGLMASVWKFHKEEDEESPMTVL
ncbi:uncharacterized protein LOC120112249 [Phoenix dactylifera]|uniref:Uncharacterized protein LOC120112249 n=1 Tax=Phoenix dactylifera TaxID=42345 RepID=A0A8B9AK05_PHODC|nr:uncharacterized protein LOC120112249 [Phoenix dactylifera]